MVFLLKNSHEPLINHLNATVVASHPYPLSVAHISCYSHAKWKSFLSFVSISKGETESLRQTIPADRMTNNFHFTANRKEMIDCTYLCNCPCRWWALQRRQLIQLVIVKIVFWQTWFLFSRFFLKAHNFWNDSNIHNNFYYSQSLLFTIITETV